MDGETIWDSTMPGLRKNCPQLWLNIHHLRQIQMNGEIPYYARDGWANRVERYKMNKRSLYELLRNVLVAPAKISDEQKDWGILMMICLRLFQIN